VRISFLEREREREERKGKEREREEVKSIAQAGNMEKILEKKRIILYTYQVLLLRK
jgi:hypothetical protein